jgi:uncharacterized protein YegP (UPF0339 family)
MIHFEIYLGNDKLWHWRLKASNGQIVCWSEGYSSKQNAEDSVAWVRLHASSAQTI